MADLALPPIVAAVLSFIGVGVVRQLALRHELLDHPNERSSHAVATPRGGGLGLVGVFVIVVLGSGAIAGDLLAGLCLVGFLAVAAVGWLDDRHVLGVGPRLVVHLVAGCLVAALALRGDASTPMAAVVFVWWVFWTVSSINIVNFMDGINGLAASQVLIFGVALGLLLQRAGGSAVLPFALAGACAGFLPWNLPRARIFLGDVGSGALGCAVAWLGAGAVVDHGIAAARVYLPLVPLFADAAVTMGNRLRDGERITTPHRRHLYQRLANGGMGHTRVTLLYAAAAIIGSFVARRPDDGSLAPWAIGFIVAVAIAGLLLDRHARSQQ